MSNKNTINFLIIKSFAYLKLKYLKIKFFFIEF